MLCEPEILYKKKPQEKKFIRSFISIVSKPYYLYCLPDAIDKRKILMTNNNLMREIHRRVTIKYFFLKNLNKI